MKVCDLSPFPRGFRHRVVAEAKKRKKIITPDQVSNLLRNRIADPKKAKTIQKFITKVSTDDWKKYQEAPRYQHANK